MMNTPAAILQDEYIGATIPAWPHKKPEITLTEVEVREKVTSVLESEFGVVPGRLTGDACIKEALDVNWYDLAAPIMTIENFFRTLLQNEVSSDRLSVDMIVDRLMGRTASNFTH